MANIAVIDDSDGIRVFMKTALQMQGHTVCVFEDAQPALDTVSFEDMDLVFMDLHMPTDGEEAIEAIRRKGIRIPIVVMSGFVGKDKKEHLLSLGAQEVVEKPLGMSEVLELAQKWIQA